MDYSKISFKGYIPSYKKYFELIKEDKTINNYITFTEYDSSLIFYESNFCGICKIIDFDEDENKEIHIALLDEYRNQGLASYIVATLSNNIFASNIHCQYAVLSIDKDNTPSIKMANKSGFKLNEELTKANLEYGDFKTLYFTKNNPYYQSLHNNL